ncbi:dethiobiotin synthase [Halomonas shantousis]
MNRYFITGTDTEIGKTYGACALLARARRQGLTTLGLKPLASDCRSTPEGLRNADALALQALSEPRPDYEQVNPLRFAPAIAPHVAARQAGETLDVQRLLAGLAPGLALERDLVLVEGAGGWRVPLNDDEDLSDLAHALGLAVIVVVGVRLGCINHARLTCEAIECDGLTVAGWIANRVDPAMASAQDTLATLHHTLAAPCLGVLPWQADAATLGPVQAAECAAAHLQLPVPTS